MKRNKRTRYVYGKRFLIGVNYPLEKLENSFKLPATAAVLDGISAVFIGSQPVAINEQPLFDMTLNNEQLIDSNELLTFCMIKTSNTALTTRIVNTYAEEYKPTPRPLSGSDEVRIRFHPGAYAGTKDTRILIHFHYQPKR